MRNFGKLMVGTEFADTCEEGKCIVKEVANRRRQLQEAERRRQARQIGSDATLEEQGGEGQRGEGDLEPMNLTFTQ